MNNKMLCNRNLPTNSINVTDVRVGMTVYSEYDPTPASVVTGVVPMGNRVLIETDARTIEATVAGTLRLVEAGYDYHADHGCGGPWSK